ncbi:MAG: DUF86 domain-containing protein [Flavobacteriaceae bacterium]|nr:DUF86 domain-containing protein [Flavobacteriaceae bacterium]
MTKEQKENLLKRCDAIESYFQKWEQLVPDIQDKDQLISDLSTQVVSTFYSFLISEKLNQMHKHVYSDLINNYPSIQWHVIKEIRNRIGHNYEKLSVLGIHDFIVEHMIPLQKELPYLREYINSEKHRRKA